MAAEAANFARKSLVDRGRADDASGRSGGYRRATPLFCFVAASPTRLRSKKDYEAALASCP